jgi:hypothetical protein
MRLSLLVVALLQLSVLQSQSQTSAPVTNLGVGSVVVPAERIASYSAAYYGGTYGSLDRMIREDIALIAKQQIEGIAEIDNEWVSFAFMARSPAMSESTVARVLVPPRGRGIVSPPPDWLPGRSHIYELIVSTDRASVVGSHWLSTLEDAPINQQLGSLGAAIALGFTTPFPIGPMRSFLGVAPPDNPVPSPNTGPLFFAANRIELPHKRSTLKVGTRIQAPAVGTTRAMLDHAEALKVELERGPAMISPCASVLISSLNDRILASTPESSVDLDPTLRRQIATDLARTTEEVLKHSVCFNEANEPSEALAEIRTEAVRDVARRFLALTNPSPQTVTSTVDLRNAPPTRFSVGVVGGGLVTRSGDEHYEISNGTLQPKPLKGVLTAAVLHFHPIGFRPNNPELTLAERFSVFGGTALTPAGGLVGGASVRVVRSLGFQASYVVLRTERLRSGFQENQSATVRDDPFEPGFMHGFVVGGSYDFK